MSILATILLRVKEVMTAESRLKGLKTAYMLLVPEFEQ